VNRLDLRAVDDSVSIARLGEEREKVARSAGKGAVEGGAEGIKEKVGLCGRRHKDDDN
jgi:hypothetical protein